MSGALTIENKTPMGRIKKRKRDDWKREKKLRKARFPMSFSHFFNIHWAYSSKVSGHCTNSIAHLFVTVVIFRP